MSLILTRQHFILSTHHFNYVNSKCSLKIHSSYITKWTVVQIFRCVVFYESKASRCSTVRQSVLSRHQKITVWFTLTSKVMFLSKGERCVQHVVCFWIPLILPAPDSLDDEKILTSTLLPSATASCLKSEVNSGNWHYLCQLYTECLNTVYDPHRHTAKNPEKDFDGMWHIILYDHSVSGIWCVYAVHKSKVWIPLLNSLIPSIKLPMLFHITLMMPWEAIGNTV